MSSTQGQIEQDRVSNLEARFTKFQETQDEILRILATLQPQLRPTESVGEVPAIVDRGKGILIDEEVESHQIPPPGARGSPAQRLREQEGLGREPHALVGPRNAAPEVRTHIGVQEQVVDPCHTVLEYQERGQEPRKEQCGRKLELPVCCGQNVRDWIYRTERYFDVNQLTSGEKLSAAGLCLEDKALSWFRWRQARDPIRSWEELRSGILERFQGSEADHEQFFALVQSGSVAEYRDRFEELSAGLEGLTDEAILGAFLKGLKDPVRAALRPFKPGTIREAMEMAQLIEERDANASIVRPSTNRGPSTWGPPSRPNQSTAIIQQPREPVRPSPVVPANPRRISEKDYADRRAKGLCFRCNEKWEIGHRCKNQHLNFIIISNDETENESSDVEEPDLPENEMKVSFISLSDPIPTEDEKGIITTDSMRLQGLLGRFDAIFLVDSGATHNFLSKEFAEDRGLITKDKGCIRVTLGTGACEYSKGLCPKVEISFPGYSVKQDFYILNIHGADAILGMAWLKTLGEVRTNWETLTMEFEYWGEPTMLRGVREPVMNGWSARLAEQMQPTIEAATHKIEASEEQDIVEDLEDKVQFNGAGIDKNRQNLGEESTAKAWSQAIKASEVFSDDYSSHIEAYGDFWDLVEGLYESPKENTMEVRSDQGLSAEPREGLARDDQALAASAKTLALALVAKETEGREASRVFEDLPEDPARRGAEPKETARRPACASKASEGFLKIAQSQVTKNTPNQELPKAMADYPSFGLFPNSSGDPKTSLFPKNNQRPEFPKGKDNFPMADIIKLSPRFPNLQEFPNSARFPKDKAYQDIIQEDQETKASKFPNLNRFPKLQDSYQQLKFIKKPIFPKGSKLPKSGYQQVSKHPQRLSTSYVTRQFPIPRVFPYFRRYLQDRKPSTNRISMVIRKPKFPKPPSRVPINREL